MNIIEELTGGKFTISKDGWWLIENDRPNHGKLSTSNYVIAETRDVDGMHRFCKALTEHKEKTSE